MAEVSHTEPRGCSQQLPEVQHSRRICGLAQRDQAHTSVTMATTSRHLTDRRYVTRKPLFSKEHVSILKMAVPKEEKPPAVAVSRTEPPNVKFSTKPGEMEIPTSQSFPHRVTSRPTASIGYPCPRVPGLHARLCQDKPSLASTSNGSKSSLKKVPSSILEFPSLNAPLRPPLTSTVLYPTYTPRSRDSGPCQIQLRLQERCSGRSFPTGNSKGVSVSSYQEDYWACAIPKAQPPSPDRHSAGWNPNKEYEALLDYTYPLRPGHRDSGWDSCELQRDSFLKTNPTLQDSGIDLDPFRSSASLSGLEASENEEEKIRDCSSICTGDRSPDLLVFPRSSDGPLSCTPLSLADLRGLDSGENKVETSSHSRGGSNQQHHAEPSTTSVHSTRGWSRWDRGEADEDFLCLPVQLEELQQLSRQVREVTAQLDRPQQTSLSVNHQPADEEDGAGVGEDNPSHEEDQRVREQRVDEDFSETCRGGLGVCVEPEGGGRCMSSMREVEALVMELCGSNIPAGQKLQEQSDSLLQLVQMFSSHLELLIQQLYGLSERMERLAAPSVDVGSVKSSLTEYQMFQKELSSHRPLTSCVLHAGQHLLSCINTISPFLRDALQLIERQSGTLQTHSDRFFSMILSAVDSLTPPAHSGLAEWRTAAYPARISGSSL
ncbi:centrosomal protein of 68 kDa isoform X2 [Nothobranchius furzeri]|uniref:Centrosomal protein 68 n=1 Tax=Nothobranchius furzeri TaxID=105023 RepID=A0A1A7ZXC6_NOTFU|nr:centrosomal protein 68kDa [Nothobranchius furzeri]